MSAQLEPVKLEALPVQLAGTEPAGELDALVPASVEPMPELSREERILIMFSSMGRTAAINCTDSEIQRTRDSLTEKTDLPHVSAIINRMILNGNLPLRQDQDPVNGLSGRDFVMLQTYAAGGTNAHIAEVLGEESRNKVITLNRRLFGKMGAWGREHSVRLAYERGAFKLGVPPIELDQVLAES